MMFNLTDTGCNTQCASIRHIAVASVYRTVQSSSAWTGFQNKLRQTHDVSWDLIPHRLLRGRFTNSFLSYMNEVYVRAAPRARMLCPEAPGTVTQAQMCKALRDDERPGVALGEVSRR
eukprot:1550865-Pyramimonas_sp.AAC.1